MTAYCHYFDRWQEHKTRNQAVALSEIYVQRIPDFQGTV
jgi:hypothetical protein